MYLLIESTSAAAYGDKIESYDGARSHTARHFAMTEAHDTGMNLLIESANALELVAGACESSDDAARLFALAERVRNYLAASRPTTTLGMPRIVSDDVRLTDENVIHRTAEFNTSHIRILD